MRRAGANPTDVEITDIINRADNDTGYLDFSVRLCLYQLGIFNYIFRNFARLWQRGIRLKEKSCSWSWSTSEKWKCLLREAEARGITIRKISLPETPWTGFLWRFLPEKHKSVWKYLCGLIVDIFIECWSREWVQGDISSVQQRQWWMCASSRNQICSPKSCWKNQFKRNWGNDKVSLRILL